MTFFTINTMLVLILVLLPGCVSIGRYEIDTKKNFYTGRKLGQIEGKQDCIQNFLKELEKKINGIPCPDGDCG